MTVYAISDLHLHCDEQPYLFTPQKEALLVKLINEILSNDAFLLIAGDCIDFTGMKAPKEGHREFFEELFTEAQLKHPVIKAALEPISSIEQLILTRDRFPTLFRELGRLARARGLIMIAGNHDTDFKEAWIQEKFAELLGVDRMAIQWRPSLRIKSLVVAAHGNQFDTSNRTVQGPDNPGSVITAALYRALMPALILYGVPETIVSAIPAVRPEEVVIHGIQHYLGKRDTKKLVWAFVKLIAKNGYFRGKQRLLTAPVSRHVPLVTPLMRRLITSDRAMMALSNDPGMKDHVRVGAEKLRLSLEPQPDVIVLGHTHELDFNEHYINLGTWIDHITGISLEHLRAADLSLPVLKISENQAIELFDARDLSNAASLDDCRRICSISVPFRKGRAA